MAKAKKKTLPEQVEALALEVRLLHNHIERLEKSWARLVVPGEAMELLAGELRAIRYLLDPKGEFRGTDVLHDAYHRNKEKWKDEIGREKPAQGGGA